MGQRDQRDNHVNCKLELLADNWFGIRFHDLDGAPPPRAQASFHAAEGNAISNASGKVANLVTMAEHHSSASWTGQEPRLSIDDQSFGVLLLGEGAEIQIADLAGTASRYCSVAKEHCNAQARLVGILRRIDVRGGRKGHNAPSAVGFSGSSVFSLQLRTVSSRL
jgi:hypothetical protein